MYDLRNLIVCSNNFMFTLNNYLTDVKNRKGFKTHNLSANSLIGMPHHKKNITSL